jgi:hypothetical protein
MIAQKVTKGRGVRIENEKGKKLLSFQLYEVFLFFFHEKKKNKYYSLKNHFSTSTWGKKLWRQFHRVVPFRLKKKIPSSIRDVDQKQKAPFSQRGSTRAPTTNNILSLSLS